MIYLGALLVVSGVVGMLLHRKTSNIIVLMEHPSGKTRIVRKFIIFKFLQDNRGIMKFGFLQTRNIVQIKSFSQKENWIDVSWASVQK